MLDGKTPLTCVGAELASHPDVLEIAVVARPHPRWGERPMAFVILHPQRASFWDGRHATFAESLKLHARGRLPGFACPEWVEVVAELPVGSYIGRDHKSSVADHRLERKRQQEKYRKLF